MSALDRIAAWSEAISALPGCLRHSPLRPPTTACSRTLKGLAPTFAVRFGINLFRFSVLGSALQRG